MSSFSNGLIIVFCVLVLGGLGFAGWTAWRHQQAYVDVYGDAPSRGYPAIFGEEKVALPDNYIREKDNRTFFFTLFDGAPEWSEGQWMSCWNPSETERTDIMASSGDHFAGMRLDYYCAYRSEGVIVRHGVVTSIAK